MATRKLIRAIQRLTQEVTRVMRMLARGVVHWLLRTLFVIGRSPLSKQAGFVLPTTVLLLLVLTLTVGSIGYRTYTRSQEAIGQRQQRVIYNAGTPAIDRAKAKLEFMFDRQRDYRLPAGIPSELQLLGMLYNDGRSIEGVQVPALSSSVCNGSTDCYTFPDETRVDLNGDGTDDNAWSYRIDADGNESNNAADGADATVVYSILFSTPSNYNDLSKAADADVAARANLLQVRHGPLSNSSQTNPACVLPGAALAPERGWIPDQNQNNTLRKNFQTNVFVQPDNANGSISTLELHQDREVNRGNKWGAWFRNDLEIFPGPLFNWNGAMHTEGSMIIGGSNFRGYLISSPYSCFYTKDASEVTSREFAVDDTTGQGLFQGQFLSGRLNDNSFSGSNAFHLYNGQGTAPITDNRATYSTGTDSTTGGGGGPAEHSLDPVIVQTLDISKGRGVANPGEYQDTAWNDQDSWFVKQGRLRQETASTVPYVDDFYRADNRYGPKPRYYEGEDGGILGAIGTPIATNRDDLTFSDPESADGAASVGLDGYWERRARVQGLRLIVGQRLELGDPLGWGGRASNGSTNLDPANEPLKPWGTCPANSSGRCNEARQRTTLWDNLAAVQSTVVYHSTIENASLDRPTACMISTVHPGTALTLANAATFQDLAFGIPQLALGGTAGYVHPAANASSNKFITTNLFFGLGTNGWEFGPDNDALFEPDVTRNPELMKALYNLAYFAGDPFGGAPSFTPVQESSGGNVHPHPNMAMWGDFSMLRRVLMEMGANPTSDDYNRLSPADKTTLHTAMCTLGILAYNLDYLEKFNPYELEQSADLNTRNLIGYPALHPNDPNYYFGLRGAIRRLWDGSSPLGDLISSGILASTADTVSQPQVYIRLLERWRDRLTNNTTGSYLTTDNTAGTGRQEMNEMINLARLIITKEQVARDRTYGFNDDAAFYGKDPLGYCALWTDSGPSDSAKTFNARDNYRYRNGGTVLYTADAGDVLDLDAILGDPNSYGLGTTLSAADRDALTNYRLEPLKQLCSRRPRYPILFSLFPAREDGTFGNPPSEDPTDYTTTAINTAYAGFDDHPELFRVTRDSQDSTDPLVWTSFINTSDVNRDIIYQVVRPSEIALYPKRMDRTDWTIPIELPSGGEARYVKNGTGITPNHNRDTLIKQCLTVCPNDSRNANRTMRVAEATGNLFRVAFKDTAPFNGREAILTRMLDVNVDLLRRSATAGGDRWLPNQAIVYAFREDAVSEREIVRPARTVWTLCNDDGKLRTFTDCRMNTSTVTALRSTDPPLNAENGITPKPVDYYPDPDRRPYGFRLKNGYRMDRPDDEGRGLSFITDNPVYIQGDFNLHQATPGGATLEEFTQTLATNFSNFYTRNSLNTNFARTGNDLWRPTEILADAISILSDNFCDGSIEDAFLTSGQTGPNLPADKIGVPTSSQRNIGYGCQTSHSRTSYLNQNRPNYNFGATGITQTTSGARWLRSNPADSFGLPTLDTAVGVDEGGSPIVVNRDGNPFYLTGNGQSYSSNVAKYGLLSAQQYYAFSSGKPTMAALTGTRVNATIISGLVPSRSRQSYGGLHNFPRFLETWSGPLFIQGSFLQLNFSNQATAPFDQDAWETNQAPVNDEVIPYYGPPERRWGYDVGLQYAPAAPISARFVTLRAIRNEFYTEPPANDPYMRRLCLVANSGTPERCPAN